MRRKVRSSRRQLRKLRAVTVTQSDAHTENLAREK